MKRQANLYAKGGKEWHTRTCTYISQQQLYAHVKVVSVAPAFFFNAMD